MVASKKAQKIRQRDEFNVAQLGSQLLPPMGNSGAYTWTIPEIRNARDAQLAGDFELPSRLSSSMRTDSALFTAWDNRMAPRRAIGTQLVPKKNARGRAIAAEAEGLFGPKGVGLHRDHIADIHSDLVQHGIAVGVNHVRVRDDGTRVDLIHEHWPIEHVRWREHERCLVTRVDEEGGRPFEGIETPIVHGDGRWVIYRKHAWQPWTKEACILAGGLVWAAHAYAIRDWSKGSTSHGNAKVIGKMPQGVKLRNKDGSLTSQARDMLDLLRAVASLDAPVGMLPFGADLDYLLNNSNAWQVWHELSINAEKAAARIYLGTDGMLGSIGGAPGVDIGQLFGVATTKVQGDFSALERGIEEGVLQVWGALNFGDSRLVPEYKYLMPDADKEATHETYAKRSEAFHADVEKHRLNGFVVDQGVVDRLAELHGVEAPRLANVVPADAAPTDGERPGLAVVS